MAPSQARYTEKLLRLKFSELERGVCIIRTANCTPTYASPRTSAERYVTVLVPFGHVLHAKVVRVEHAGVRVQVRAVVRDYRRYRHAGAPRQHVVGCNRKQTRKWISAMDVNGVLEFIEVLSSKGCENEREVRLSPTTRYHQYFGQCLAVHSLRLSNVINRAVNL